MLNFTEQTLRAAKAKYIQEILFDYEFGRCETRDIIHAFNTIIDVNADEFYALMALANSPEDRYLLGGR